MHEKDSWQLCGLRVMLRKVFLKKLSWMIGVVFRSETPALFLRNARAA